MLSISSDFFCLFNLISLYFSPDFTFIIFSAEIPLQIGRKVLKNNLAIEQDRYTPIQQKFIFFTHFLQCFGYYIDSQHFSKMFLNLLLYIILPIFARCSAGTELS